MKRIKNFELKNKDWMKSLPVPVFDKKPEYLDLYRKAWDLARNHMRDIPGLPQTPYIDEAFWNTDIWIWDTCFMMFFCKYAPDVFPGIESLNNFYKPLHEKASMPKVIPDEYTARTHIPGVPNQFCIHIPDNPPLFAWAEFSYALMSGDKQHLRELLLEKQYLQKHFEFLEHLDAPDWKLETTRAPTCWIKRENGYFWEGGRSGMDNTPRGRSNGKATKTRPNNPELLWIDAISQQALSCLYIVRIAGLLGEDAIASEWQKKYDVLKEKINRLYWNEEDGTYYDLLESTMEPVKCLTPASYWSVLAEIPDADRVERMCQHLMNPEKLGGMIPWPSVSRDDADFIPDDGNYWRGNVWMPTAYMGIKGLEKYGKFDLARQHSETILNHMYRTWQEYEPHTIWECYSPTKFAPGMDAEAKGLCRPDFCGWSALGPISLLIENIIGITNADAFTGTVTWHLPPEIEGKLGVRNYTFGDITASLIYENGTVKIESDAAFTLKINDKTYPVPAGNSSFAI